MRRGVCEAFLALLLVGVLSSPFQARSVNAWAGTVYMRGDGSIDPSDAPILRKFGVYWLTLT